MEAEWQIFVAHRAVIIGATASKLIGLEDSHVKACGDRWSFTHPVIRKALTIIQAFTIGPGFIIRLTNLMRNPNPATISILTNRKVLLATQNARDRLTEIVDKTGKFADDSQVF